MFNIQTAALHRTGLAAEFEISLGGMLSISPSQCTKSQDLRSANRRHPSTKVARQAVSRPVRTPRLPIAARRVYSPTVGCITDSVLLVQGGHSPAAAAALAAGDRSTWLDIRQLPHAHSASRTLLGTVNGGAGPVGRGHALAWFRSTLPTHPEGGV